MAAAASPSRATELGREIIGLLSGSLCDDEDRVEGRAAEEIFTCMENGADLNAVQDGVTPLIKAIGANWQNDQERTAVIAELVKRADVNYVPENGQSALFCAMVWYDFDTMRLLLDNGADVDVKSYGSTTLRESVVQNNIEAAKILLAYGADLSLPGVNGLTPAACAAGLPNGEVFIALFKAEEAHRAEIDRLSDLDDRIRKMGSQLTVRETQVIPCPRLKPFGKRV